LIAGTPPPLGVFLFGRLPIKNLEEEDTPRSTWYKLDFFEGVLFFRVLSEGTYQIEDPPGERSLL